MGEPYVRVQSVTVYVRDQDRSLRFFRELLGFHLAYDVTLQSGLRLVAVSPPEGDAVLMLVAPAPNSLEHKLIGRATQVTFVTDNVLARFDEWRKRGVRFRNTPRLRRVRYGQHQPSSPGDTPVWGAVFTRFQDPDGNSFVLAGFDEVNREIERRRREAAEKLEAERRAAQELEIAKQVQARLFPQTRPTLNTLEYAGACVQARQVGGDYFDFLRLGSDRLALIIGDIAGKGIAAALLMANLQAYLRSQCSGTAGDLPTMLRSINQLFFDNTPENAYATLFIAEYHDESRTLRYANCGHLPGLLLRREGAVERLQSTSTVLGLFGEWDCESGECCLEPGDALLMYTDGVTEAFNAAGEEYGDGRLIDALRAGRDLCSEALVASIAAGVQRFSPGEQQDDITVVAAKCTC